MIAAASRPSGGTSINGGHPGSREPRGVRLVSGGRSSCGSGESETGLRGEREMGLWKRETEANVGRGRWDFGRGTGLRKRERRRLTRGEGDGALGEGDGALWRGKKEFREGDRWERFVALRTKLG